MKLCKDCIHCERADAGFSKCFHAPFVHEETGQQDHIFCNIERQNLTGCCGPDAKFFTPNPQPKASEV